MKIKEFEALNLKDCLTQVRQELGPEAVILETRKFRKGGIMGWGAKDAVRIVAATGVSVQDPPGRGGGRQAAGGSGQAAVGSRQSGNGKRPTAAAEHTINGSAKASAPSAPAPVSTESDEKLRRLEREMSELRSGIDAIRQAVVNAPQQHVAPAYAYPPPGPQSWGGQQQAVAYAAAQSPQEALLHPDLYRKLLEAEVGEEMAIELLRALPDLSAWKSQARAPLAESALRDVMAARIKSSGPIQLKPGRTQVVALIGPTGVGKTTTIAKLAANYALVEKKRVGLVTMDTYRIAAVEQLKTYSQIIDIPIRVAYTQAEVAPALESFAGYDVVLVDTAGRSQKNLMQVSELKSLVDAAGCETHLVISASTKEKDLFDQIARFREANVDRLLFTKLDETTTYGTMYTVAAKTNLPISYITTGQKVPEDIEPADGVRLATLVMNSLPSQ